MVPVERSSIDTGPIETGPDESGPDNNLERFGKYFEPEFQATQSENVASDMDVDKLHAISVHSRNGWLGTLYIDNTGEVVLAAKYPFAGPFCEGLAVVGTAVDVARGHTIVNWGFIDRTGRLAIKPTYDRCEPFSEGLAPVEKNGKYGYVNRQGKLVIPHRYRIPYSFDRGIACVKPDYGTVQFIDKSGKVLFETHEESCGSFSEGLLYAAIRGADGDRQIGYLDTNFELAFLLSDKSSDYLPFGGHKFSDGMAAVAVMRGGKDWGYVSRQGELVIPGPFFQVGPFSEGLAAVNNVRRGKPSWGYIDNTGKTVVEPQFVVAQPFSEGLAVVRVSNEDLPQPDSTQSNTPSSRGQGKCGYIDTQGRFVIAPQFETARSFKNGLALVDEDSHSRGYIDRTGKYVLKVDM